MRSVPGELIEPLSCPRIEMKMKSEHTLKKTGQWTSFITRKTNELKRGLMVQLDREPTARDKIMVELIGIKAGVVMCLQRTLKNAQIVDERGDVAPRVSKSLLAWIAALERSVMMLLGEGNEEALRDVPAIDERFRSKNGKE